MRSPKSREVAWTGMLFALAIALSFLESAITPLLGLMPAMKLGLSNLVVMYALLFLNTRTAAELVLLKALFALLTRGPTAGFLSLCGGVLWGVNATVSKILMGTYHASPLWIACVRELAAGVLFLTCSAIMTPKLLTGALRDRKSYPRLLATAIICVLLVQVAYLESINWTNSGTATVLQSLNLLFVLGVVCLRGRRLPGVREGIGVALAFAGTVLIATGGDFTTLKLPLVGLIWGAINAASTAAMVFLPVKLIERWGNFTVNGIAFLISGLVLLPFVRPWATAPQLDWLGVGLMAFTVIGGTFGAFWLYMAGVVRVGSMRATMLGTSEPVMATISAVAWTDAVFEPTDLVGFVMILIMVFLVR